MLMLFARIINGFLPVFHNMKNVHPIKGVMQFIKDWKQFQKYGGEFKIIDLYPCLYDRYGDCGNIPKHYFHQDLWASTKIFKYPVDMHYDLGSRVDGFLAHILPYQKTTMIDIRPLSFSLENLSFVQSDFTKLPFENNSIESISALHSIEHVGLGRYGDQIDPYSWKQSITEIKRVLKINGIIYFSVPIGRERICFNAFRVFNPSTILREFGKDFELIEFSVITDTDELIRNADIKKYETSNYACGLYMLKKVSNNEDEKKKEMINYICDICKEKI